jgi:aspartyl aminopeptidase
VTLPTDDALVHARDLLTYLHAAPTPHHVVSETSSRLDAAGFSPLDQTAEWPATAGRFYVIEGGAIIAWVTPDAGPSGHGFSIIGAHTDSPGFRIKPRPDTGRAGFRQLGAEVYGGPLLNSWLDRDLGLAGRVVFRRPDGFGSLTFRDDRPILRIPQLAIHLDRDVNDKGLQLDRQRHLQPVWGLGDVDEGGFRTYLGEQLHLSPDQIESWDVLPFDVQPAALSGPNEEFVSGARLDNLVSCHAGLCALIAVSAAAPAGTPPRHIPVLALFDHEEVGSTSATGADGALLGRVLERITLSGGGTRDDHLRALAGSHCISADMAHATHPNYPERHDPDHPVRLDGGPVIKINAQLRYASEAVGAASFAAACERADVPVQRFVSNNTMPCGSTIGPLTAANLGIRTLDVGVAQLGMHSIRELCGSADPHRLTQALVATLHAS